jgi:hypothetical protein
MQFWKILLLNPTKDWERFVKEEAVFIGQFGPEDLAEVDKYTCKEDLEKFLGEGAASELWEFSNEIKIGDVVIAATAKNVLGVGKVTGKYTYEPIYDPKDECYHKSHIRRMKWVEITPSLTPTPGDMLFKPLPKGFDSLNDQVQIVELSEEEWEAITNKYPKIKEAHKKLTS